MVVCVLMGGDLGWGFHLCWNESENTLRISRAAPGLNSSNLEADTRGGGGGWAAFKEAQWKRGNLCEIHFKRSHMMPVISGEWVCSLYQTLPTPTSVQLFPPSFLSLTLSHTNTILCPPSLHSSYLLNDYTHTHTHIHIPFVYFYSHSLYLFSTHTLGGELGKGFLFWDLHYTSLHRE